MVDEIFNANARRAVTATFNIVVDNDAAVQQQEILQLIEDEYRVGTYMLTVWYRVGTYMLTVWYRNDILLMGCVSP